MTEQADPIDVLERQITALTDTHSNLAGLIQKTSRVQTELSEGRLETQAARIEGIFAALSDVAEELQAVIHGLEIERNRLQSQG